MNKRFIETISGKNEISSAFTLAEVLITLAIIGVVAAMTMPTLISNHQKQVYVTALKKGVNTVQNMVNKMKADEEASSIYNTKLFADGLCSQGKVSCEDGYGDVSVLDNLIPSYIKTVKTCSNHECDIKYRDGSINNEGNFTALNYEQSVYRFMDWARDGIRGYYGNDGMIYYFGFVGNADRAEHIVGNGLALCIDVNGEKGPNTKGRDFFCYAYCPNLGEKLIGGNQYECENREMGYSRNTTIEEHLFQNGWKMDY